MTSGVPASRSASGPISFDFGSDDVLCSYDDFTPQLDQAFNGQQSNSSVKDLHESRTGRPLTNLYGQLEDFSRDDAISAVEKCMKKYADNLSRNLEGISGRLTQLELYCFKLEKSIGEFRADMIREQGEADLKLKSLEKDVHEVHKSVQIIRDKQELSETQKELSKLHLPQKEPTNLSNSPKTNEGLSATAPSEIKAHNSDSDTSNLQLALALPQQTTYIHDQTLQYKQSPTQLPSPSSFAVSPQDHYVLNQANSYYPQQRAQMHDFSIQAPTNQQINPTANTITQQPPFAQYRPIQPQQFSSQSQAARPQNPSAFAIYSSNQPTNTIQTETYFSAPQSSGYGVSGRHLPQSNQVSFGPSSLAKSGYIGAIASSPQPNMQGYNSVYVVDENRAPLSHNFQPGRYPPNTNVAPNSQIFNNPYGEMIEKAIGMGYPRDQVVSVAMGMGESGQPLDLNALLDRLNVLASGGTRRPWSG